MNTDNKKFLKKIYLRELKKVYNDFVINSSFKSGFIPLLKELFITKSNLFKNSIINLEFLNKFDFVIKKLFNHKYWLINNFFKFQSKKKKLKIKQVKFYIFFQIITFITKFYNFYLSNTFKTLKSNKKKIMSLKKIIYKKKIIFNHKYQLRGIRMCFSGRTNKRNMMAQTDWLDLAPYQHHP